MENYILYIQYECDDVVKKEVEEIIDFYAGGIDSSTLRKADKYLLFKNTYLIHSFYKYPSVEDCMRDISDKLQRAVYHGKGRYILINIPKNRDERNKMLDAWISTDAIEWLNNHVVEVRESTAGRKWIDEGDKSYWTEDDLK